MTGSTAAFSQSLERGLLILSEFGESGPVLGIADLARAVNLNRSTTHRYVATLTKLGYLQQDPDTRKYSLGPRSSTSASPRSARWSSPAWPPPLRPGRRSQPARGLAAAGVLHVDGQGATGVPRPGGAAAPARPDGPGRPGPKTITVREQLVSMLAKVRKAGIAVNAEELAPGLRSIAAPIRDRSGHVVEAINVAVHLTTWTTSVDSVVNRLERPPRRASGDISAQLGYRPPR